MLLDVLQLLLRLDAKLVILELHLVLHAQQEHYHVLQLLLLLIVQLGISKQLCLQLLHVLVVEPVLMYVHQLLQ